MIAIAVVLLASTLAGADAPAAAAARDVDPDAPVAALSAPQEALLEVAPGTWIRVGVDPVEVAPGLLVQLSVPFAADVESVAALRAGGPAAEAPAAAAAPARRGAPPVRR